MKVPGREGRGLGSWEVRGQEGVREAWAELGTEDSRGGGPERSHQGRGKKVLRWLLVR